LKYFNISLTSLGNFTGIGSGSLSTLVGLSISLLLFLPVLIRFTFGVNFVETFCLNELLFMSA